MTEAEFTELHGERIYESSSCTVGLRLHLCLRQAIISEIQISSAKWFSENMPGGPLHLISRKAPDSRVRRHVVTAWLVHRPDYMVAKQPVDKIVLD